MSKEFTALAQSTFKIKQVHNFSMDWTSRHLIFDVPLFDGWQTEVFLTLYCVQPVPCYAYGRELDIHVQSWMCGHPWFPFSVVFDKRPEYCLVHVRAAPKDVPPIAVPTKRSTDGSQVELPSCRCISLDSDGVHKSISQVGTRGPTSPLTETPPLLAPNVSDCTGKYCPGQVSTTLLSRTS